MSKVVIEPASYWTRRALFNLSTGPVRVFSHEHGAFPKRRLTARRENRRVRAKIEKLYDWPIIWLRICVMINF